MPRCVTNEKLTELSKHSDPDIAHTARELLGARTVLARHKAASKEFSLEERSAMADLATGLQISLYGLKDEVYRSLKARGFIKLRGQQIELTRAGARAAESLPSEEDD